MIENTVWSDNWWIEENSAWFVDGERNMLFSLDLQTKQYKFLKQLPDNSPNKFRLNSRCIKCEDAVFCFPDIGRYIWVYLLKTSEFEKIEVKNEKNIRLVFNNFWKYGERIFAISVGLGQIIEIDINKREIIAYNDLSDSTNIQIGVSTKVGTKIYCISVVTNEVYEFDLRTRKTFTYQLPYVKGGLYTICYDGYNFWLSGYYKEVYVWNRENNTIKVIDELPEDFGVYNFSLGGKYLLDCEAKKYNMPAFLNAVFIQNAIWFIPFQTNKIIYIDKNTHKINTFEVEEEDENEESLINRRLNHKYLLEYIREDRYIGLYSFKNKCIIQIDALEKQIKKEEYILGNNCLLELAHLYKKYGRICNESIDIDKKVFAVSLYNFKENNIIAKNNGLNIYKSVIQNNYKI